jgi:hypothetical protein
VVKNLPFFNCVAVSQTSDPTGAYFRYAFTTGQNFPDYPKYGVMPNGLFITTREFQGGNELIGVSAINRQQLVAGDPNTQFVRFQLNKPEYLRRGRGDGAAERRGCADHDQLALGRLHVDERRPQGRLHVLVHQRVLRPLGDSGGREALADARRRIPLPGL